MAFEPGEVFAGYRIIDVLGTGGMGTVYRVSHPRLEREEALKTVRAQTGMDNADERFRREARAAANLHHPGIVTIHEFGVTDGVPWYTMDYLAGEDLAATAGQLPAPTVAQTISQVAAALDYAHARSVIHRDVKPANIILTRAPSGHLDRAILVDFGIVKDTATNPVNLTQPFAPLGSPPYMAPEIIRGEPASPASDQYSLAVTAFQALTGHTPYTGSTGELLAAHTTAPPPAISRHRPDLAAADHVLTRALAKNPAERYPTCTDFATALGAAISTPSQQTLIPGAMTTPIPPAVSRPPQPNLFPTPAAHTPYPGTAINGPFPGGVTSPTFVTVKPKRKRKKYLIAAVVAILLAAGGTVGGIVATRDHHPIQNEAWHIPNPPGVQKGSWTSISTAANYGLNAKGITACGIAAGKVYCWGTDDSRYQLGTGKQNGPTTQHLVAGQKSDSNVSDISVGSDYSCAIGGPKRKVSCWGTGPLNVSDDKKDTEGPVTDAISISTSPYRACAVVADGTVKCWGATGALIPPFDKSKPGSDRATAMNIFPPSTAVLTTLMSTCVISTGPANVTCQAQTATGAPIEKPSDFPAYAATIAGPSGVVALAATGFGKTWCAVTKTSVYCWGQGLYGMVGNGQNDVGPFSPTRVDVLTDPTSVSGGDDYFCAAAHGLAYCWGNDVLKTGRLGLPAGEYYVPTQVPGLSRVTQVAAGVTFTCAIADGERYCWGQPPKAA
ncbi:protein kinase [Gordonia sp. X0973]|uniref:protein kinase domain-containing protein n=1 Tax=Gordonia sp. X0973 TaxID=2742602 RepID=UPI000F525B48|nr:protein kinase [Gordonia sp. X0973]QKT06957.1 protein kinase [Gordonia sp. X0973]